MFADYKYMNKKSKFKAFEEILWPSLLPQTYKTVV
jgi:hypothetical protein